MNLAYLLTTFAWHCLRIHESKYLTIQEIKQKTKDIHAWEIQCIYLVTRKY